MNVKRFLARTPREALALVRQAFGSDAVVMQTKPAPEGVEMLAMAPDSVLSIEPFDAASLAAGGDVQADVEQLSMSTLSFQDYVRERMAKRRQAEQAAQATTTATPASTHAAPHAAPTHAAPQATAAAYAGAQAPPAYTGPHTAPTRIAPHAVSAAQTALPRAPLPLAQQAAAPTAPPMPAAHPPVHASAPALREASPIVLAPAGPSHDEMLAELRSMKSLIEERFGALAFIDKLQRQPAQGRLAARLLDAGFSPALAKKVVEALPNDVADETAWGASVLERNLMSGEAEPALEDQGGVYALIGPTGVGKTTSTAKLAAAFATRHGSAALGLVTLDAYRVAAHEQLRTYGRILGVPVHTAHDRASLEDLLELLAGKKMVLIDTAGTAQRDARTRELLEMVSQRTIHKLLVVNAAAQGETLDDVMSAYRAAACRGAVLSKIDEAVKLGPALDALIRHKLPVLGVANGQRVPEDWHRLSSHALVQRALRERMPSAWRLDAGDVNLVFAGVRRAPQAQAPA